MHPTENDVGKEVLIAFPGDQDQPWTAYGGPGILIEHDASGDWGEEPHFRVKLPDGNANSYFPASCIWLAKG